MPRLRFTRDERGYEHTVLVHSTRRRGRERTSVLYWFRSPPSVRVGRSAIDSDTIRAIEQANPDIVFDWTAILAARPPEPEPIEGWRARRGRAGRDGDTRPSAPGQEPSGAAVPAVTASPSGSPPTARADGVSAVSAPSPNEPPPEIGVDIEGDAVFEASAVQRALGSEGLMRVRARYAEVRARISTQVDDEAVADELRGLAERLNPDGWVTEDDVRAGLEGFERVLEDVRQRLGPPHRPRRERAGVPVPPASNTSAGGGGGE